MTALSHSQSGNTLITDISCLYGAGGQVSVRLLSFF